MSTTITNLISSKVISNLDTYVYTVGTTSLHVARLTINEIPPSGIIITLKQNSTTIATTSAPNAAQQVVELMATLACTSGDVISFVVASANAADARPNAFKGILNIHIGSGN